VCSSDLTASRLHERSRFVRESDAAGLSRWYYVDGDLQARA
jgi:SEC-C motif-containing protein